MICGGGVVAGGGSVAAPHRTAPHRAGRRGAVRARGSPTPLARLTARSAARPRAASTVSVRPAYLLSHVPETSLFGAQCSGPT